MNRLKFLFAALVVAATVAVVPVANAQVVHYIGAGSSAMFQGFGVAAYNDLAGWAAASPVAPATVECKNGTISTVPTGSAAVAGDSCTTSHWSVKTASGIGGVKDGRSASIPVEFGNLWVVFVTDTTKGVDTDVWAYLSVDSTVGVRTFLATPRAKLVLSAAGPAAPNVIAANLFADDSSDITTLPADVLAAVGGSPSTGAPLTAGMTDIRPEDAKLATERILGTVTGFGPDTVPTLTNDFIYSFSLGYGPGPVGTQIKSGETGSTAAATPVEFSLPGGTDPISSASVSNTINVFPVGESPIVVVANRGTATVGHLGELWTTDTVACSSAPEGPAGCTSVAHVHDGGPLVRNMWSQHPFPSVALTFPNVNPQASPSYCSSTGAGTAAASGICHGPRRPLGSFFAGFDCETDSSAFTWPLDPATSGIRRALLGNASAITIFLREPLSGTYNTFEYNEVRIVGTPGGSQGGNGGSPVHYEATPYISQETNIVPTQAGNDPLIKTCPLKYVGPGEPADTAEGTRIRGIGTGEVFNGPGGTSTTDGVLNTLDSIAYGFFSFGNVSKLGAKPKLFGYLMIDGVDPLFTDYNGAGGEPGQPVNYIVGSTPADWGDLPVCGGAAPQPACSTAAVWGASVLSYPHLRDGSYPAWSELRMLCDPNDPQLTAPHCTLANDTFGGEALIENLQADIHFDHVGGVPDLLPFSDAASGPLSFNPPYGDANFIRSHYNPLGPNDTDNALGQGGNSPPPVGLGPWQRTMWASTRQGGTQPSTGSPSDPAVFIDFNTESCAGGAAPGVPVNGPPTAECGGDAGGFILPIGGTTVNNLQ